MGTHRSLLTIAAALVTVLACPSAVAQAEDVHLSAALFDAGIQKLKSGGCEKTPVADPAACEEALDAFHRSHRAYAGALGSLKNAALVERNLGRIASAVRDLRALAIAAAEDPRPERREWATLAREEIAILLPRVPRLRVGVPSPPPPDLEIRVDGLPLIAAAWNTFVEVDPGRHVITANAEKRMLMTRELVLEAGGEARVEVASGAPDAAVAPSRDGDRGPPPRRNLTPPTVVIAVGAASAVVGLVFGGLAIKTHGDVCDERNLCEPDGLDRGRSYATVANVLVGAGLVTAAAGVVWYLLERRNGNVRGASSVPPFFQF
jgi:hypothetical protein